MQSTRLIRRQPQVSQSDLCSTFCSLYIAARGFSTSHIHHAATGSNNATLNPMHSTAPGTTRRAKPVAKFDPTKVSPKRQSLLTSASDRIAAAKRRADAIFAEQQEKAKQGPVQGGLARGNIFEDAQIGGVDQESFQDEDDGVVREDLELSKRAPSNMAIRLDPKPNARARWTRTMVIRDIRRRGRLTQVMRIARTERQHLSKSRFLKTSIKKLAPLARQIAGKSLDEAILQMRFSSKKAAQDVRQHLIQARNEAIVQAGMGMPDPKALEEATPRLQQMKISTMIRHAMNRLPTLVKKPKSGLLEATQSTAVPPSYEIVDPSNIPALPKQLHTKALKKGVTPNPTDMYVAQAWVNRGAYEPERSCRARGRSDILMHPHTGISVLLKEEKTRTREKQDKEIKAIRKRLNGKLWTQMPDRPIVRQSQYVLW